VVAPRLPKANTVVTKVSKNSSMVLKNPKADMVMASEESSWIIAERRAIKLVEWPKTRPLPLQRQPELDQPLIDFITSDGSTGFIATFAMAMCLGGVSVPRALLGFCVGYVILYLAWQRHQRPRNFD
jgi:hypothetical protein